MNLRPVSGHWVTRVERAMTAFAQRFQLTVSARQRAVAASFEIGCFLSLVRFYSKVGTTTVENVTSEGEFRYLTSPNGNPANFSYVAMQIAGELFELRQQVRVRSHLDPDIAFTPDVVVLRAAAHLDTARDPDFAGGKRAFYSVASTGVVALHECKSLPPFPELLVSFLGMVVAGHAWMTSGALPSRSSQGRHVAPTLFVGGSARALQKRMVKALEGQYPINVLLGVHDPRGVQILNRHRVNVPLRTGEVASSATG